jgi:hypothetical protein
MSRTAKLPALTLEEQREAAALARDTALNPAAIERMAAELALLRAVVRQARRLPYLRNSAPVRLLLDRLPRPL